MQVTETGLILLAEPIQGVGSQPELSGRLFGMKEGDVTPAMRVATGWVFATVTGRQDAYIPKLDEVKTRVADDVKQEKAVEMAKQRAASIATELKGAKDFAAAVKRAGLEIKPTELVDPRIGDSRSRHQRGDRHRRVRAAAGRRQRRDHHADRHRDHARRREGQRHRRGSRDRARIRCATSW